MFDNSLAKNNKYLNLNIKKIDKIISIINEEELIFLENLESLKNKLKIEDLSSLNNWDQYKKKSNSYGIKSPKKLKTNNINYIKYKEKMTKNLILNIIKFNKKLCNSSDFTNFKENNLFFNFKNNKFINYLTKKYNNIGIKKLNSIRNGIFFKNNNFLIIVLDLRNLKTKLVVNSFKKSILFLTNGMMFKQLQLNNKKYKKSDKLSYLILKNMFLHFNYFRKNKVILDVKGVRKNINNFISYINKNIKNKDKIYLNNFYISKNKYFKFKKIKSIKRKLKKKIIKYK